MNTELIRRLNRRCACARCDECDEERRAAAAALSTVPPREPDSLMWAAGEEARMSHGHGPTSTRVWRAMHDNWTSRHQIPPTPASTFTPHDSSGGYVSFGAYREALLARQSDSVSPREQALHDALRKWAVREVPLMPVKMRMNCYDCGQFWPMNEPETHAPGCLAAPAAQQPPPALPVERWRWTVHGMEPMSPADSSGGYVTFGAYKRARDAAQQPVTRYRMCMQEDGGCAMEPDPDGKWQAVPEVAAQQPVADAPPLVCETPEQVETALNWIAAQPDEVADGRADALLRDYWAAHDLFKAAAENPKCTGDCFIVPRDAMFAAEAECRAYLAQLPAQQPDPDWQPETKHDL